MAAAIRSVARLAASLAGWSAGRPLVVIVVALAVTVAAAVVSVRHLGINTDNFDMISAEAPFRKANIAFREAFPWYGDQVAVVIDAPTPEQADNAAETLAARMQAREELFRFVTVQGGERYFKRQGLLFYDIDTLQNFVDQLAAAQGLLAMLAQQPNLVGLIDTLGLALREADPKAEQTRELTRLIETVSAMAEGQASAPEMLSWRQQFSTGDDRATSTRRIVTSKPVQNFESLAPAAVAIDALRAMFANADPDIRYRVTGDAALDTQELESVKLGGSTAGILSALGIVVLLVIGLRQTRMVLATVAVVIMGLIISLGYATVSVGQLNLLSVAFAVLFIGLAVDFSIHFALRSREAGGGRAGVVEAGHSVGDSLLLSAVAAAIGFLAFLPTDYRGLAELGIIAGGSMGVAVLLNLTLLPALLSIGARGGTAQAPKPAGSFWIGRNARAIIALGVLLGVAGAALTPFARFDFNPLNLKDRSAESVATFLELAAGPNAGAYTIDGLARDRAAAEELARKLRALPESGRVLTLQSFVPENQEEKLQAIESASLFLFPVLSAEAAPPPTDAERQAALDRFVAAVQGRADEAGQLGAAARRLATALQLKAGEPGALAELERRVTGLLPDWLADLRLAFEARPVSLEELPPALRSAWVTEDGRYRIQVFPTAPITNNDDMARFADAIRSVMPAATGTPLVVTAAGQEVLQSFQTATVVAAIAVILLMALMLRRVTDVGLTAIPLALSAVMTLGAAVALGESLNFANVIVLPLLFGLGVASSIHLVLRRREVDGAEALMRSSTPRAVLFSVLTTLASFGSLAVSPHVGMASMGRLLTIAILCTLFATLLFLPALVHLLPKGRD